MTWNFEVSPRFTYHGVRLRIVERGFASSNDVAHASRMGHFVYGENARYEFDDRTLAHLKIAVGAKLRRQESFYLSWIVPASRGSGRVTVWVAPSIPVQFQFRSKSAPQLNREWLKALAMTALSERGMVVLDESETPGYLRDHPTTQSTS